MESPEMEHVTDYFVSNELQSQSSSSHFALIILNFDLPKFFPVLWAQSARLRICADGGANRLHDELPTFFPERDPDELRASFIPDVIKGDLDSLRPEVQEFYATRGSLIIDASEDQDSTDLHKCIDFILSSTADFKNNPLKILVVGALGGRMDHEFGHVHILYRFSHVRIVLLGNYCQTYLLPSGFRHRIKPNLSLEGPHCGLLPVGEKSGRTTTTGLQWNLDSLPMSFGTLISTSNKIASEVVTVESDVDLVWTVEFR